MTPVYVYKLEAMPPPSRSVKSHRASLDLAGGVLRACGAPISPVPENPELLTAALPRPPRSVGLMSNVHAPSKGGKGQKYPELFCAFRQ